MDESRIKKEKNTDKKINTSENKWMTFSII